MLIVKHLFFYPVKSARGVSLESMSIDRTGPKYDRRWMVVNRGGKFLTQRQFPKMCLIETQLNGDTLILSSPGFDTIHVSKGTKDMQVTVWRDTVLARDCGDDVAQWLSDYLAKDCHLVEMPEQTQRLVDTDFAGQGETVGFADGFPLLIASQASLNDFNSKLETPIGFDRFRPNIVVDGCEPYAEDDWREVQIGDIRMSIVKPCSRCIIPSIEQTSGNKQMVVNEALLEYRRRGAKTYFGQNALHQNRGEISVGDAVRLIE